MIDGEGNSRRALLATGLAIQNDDVFVSGWQGSDPVMQNVLIILREWARYGAQTVEMPATYAAGLTMTDAKAAITPETILPWPAFAIIVPDGLLISPTGEVHTVLVARRPEGIKTRGGGVGHDYLAAYAEFATCACHTFATLGDLVEPESAPGSLGYHAAPSERSYDEAGELRVWQCIGRLVGGVLLAIEHARAERPSAYPHAAPRFKPRPGGAIEQRPNTWKLGKPMKLDLRPQVREFVTGRHGGGGVPSVSTMVRGHWKRQHHGKGRALRKLVEIKPYLRGEGAMLIRGTELRDREPTSPKKEGGDA